MRTLLKNIILWALSSVLEAPHDAAALDQYALEQKSK